MTKKPKRKKKKPKKKAKAKAKVARRRRARVKPIRGPFQIELPLQMPLFPMEPSVSAPPRAMPPPAAPTPPTPAPQGGNSQPLLVAPSMAP